jgi:hypothetical protein
MTDATDIDDLPPPYEYRTHALLVRPGIGWDDWVGLWSSTERMQKSSAFWVGDALLAGRAEFGERFAQVIDPKYIEQQRGPMWVCERIPPPRRRESLSYSLHREIAALSAEVQDRWLDKAEAGSWTVRQLKEALEVERQARAAYPSNGTPPSPTPTEAGSTWNEPADDEPTFGTVEEVTGEPLERDGIADVPEPAAEPFRAPAPVGGDGADYIRALIAAVRQLAPDLSADWKFGAIVDDRGQATVKLTKGQQLAIGIAPSLPAALVEAALSAMLSDMGAG